MTAEPDPQRGTRSPIPAGHSPDPTDDPHLVRCALLAGYRDLAEHVALAAARRAAAFPAHKMFTAVSAHCAGLLVNDVDELLRAVSLLDVERHPLAHAAALGDAAGAVADSHPSRAAAMLEAAMRIYERAGAVGHAGRIRSALRDLGVHRRRRTRPGGGFGWSSLTPSELDVIRIICSGATNREAAEQLFLSPHTVSTHLRHTYAKLGISSRVELTRIAVSRIDLPARRVA